MIVYDRENRYFTLHTAHTTYQMQVDATGRLLHLYYGARTEARTAMGTPHPDAGCWPDLLPQEWPAPGMGDNHQPFFDPEFADGTEASLLTFADAEILPGKYALPGMPAFFVESTAEKAPANPQAKTENDAPETLKITLKDNAGLTVTLLYGVLPDCDLITRAAVVENTGSAPLTLRGVPSLCLDMGNRPLDLLTFDGKWAGERNLCRAAVRPGVQSIGSVGGIPTHAHNPFAVLADPETGEEQGSCWGFALVYSGNFLLQTEGSASGTRLSMGISPYHFKWTLAPGERFTTPEAAMVYSAAGFGTMSRHFHDAIRGHLLRGRWSDLAQPRPVLINSWEACYFDFTEEKLLELAAAAKQADIDLFVLDDGWFRGRNDDTTSLGDWVAEPAKLPGGIAGLCKKINALGMGFGIWFEPEAVSPDSELYRAHPDWAFQIPGRETLPIRHQYTLDFSRAEVRDAIWQQMTAILDSCPVQYLKWDMNRSLANVRSAALPAARQGEVYHRYVLGVYDLQQKLIDRYPDLLLENCAGGGARFDCGMLYYSTQIWCSDNTDAQARLDIQYGTSFCYPPCVMGAHFSTVPNHCNGHVSCPEARMAAALTGTFGFELDLTKYTPAQLEELRPWVAFYRAHGALLRTGDLYRLCPPAKAGIGAAWMVAAKDGGEAVVSVVGTPLDGRRLPLRGLSAEANYTLLPAEPGEKETLKTCTGAELMAHGLPLPNKSGSLPGWVCLLRWA